jgi:hypothetical protein
MRVPGPVLDGALRKSNRQEVTRPPTRALAEISPSGDRNTSASMFVKDRGAGPVRSKCAVGDGYGRETPANELIIDHVADAIDGFGQLTDLGNDCRSAFQGDRDLRLF